MTGDDLFPYGRYKGKIMKNMPKGFMLYLYNQGTCRGELRQYLEDNIHLWRREPVDPTLQNTNEEKNN